MGIVVMREQILKRAPHHGKAERQAQRHGYGINSRPPSATSHDGLVDAAYEGFFQILKPAKKIINLIKASIFISPPSQPK
jgi:hypothetical protein